MITNIYVWKPYKDAKFKIWAVWLRAHRVSANTITLAGLILGLSAAGCLLAHQHLLGVVLIVLSIGADILDGTVARLENVETISGKILDSVCDRLVEAAWVGVLVFTGIIDIWALTLVLGSILLFICRLWAHRCKMSSSLVIITRFERMAAMLAVVIIPWRTAALLIYTVVTIGTFISSGQIITMILKLKSGNNTTQLPPAEAGGS
jgi:phosphatidylglycerophosphate synthase